MLRQGTFLSDFLKSGPRSHDTSALSLRRPTVSSSTKRREGRNWRQESKMPETHCLTQLILPVYRASPGRMRSILSGSTEKRVVLSIPLYFNSNMKYYPIMKTLLGGLAHRMQKWCDSDVQFVIVTGSKGRCKPYVVVSLTSTDISYSHLGRLSTEQVPPSVRPVGKSVLHFPN